MRPLYLTASSIALTCASGPTFAQDAPLAAQVEEIPVGETRDDTEIVVVAERIRGQVDTDIPPVIELNEEEIAAYGAGSIADLVEALAPQTSSGSGRGGGRPVFLVNGQRVSGFREFSRYPPEAIRKVEVLPEEVALQFGFSADQRVINFILKDNFASREIEGELGGPTRGGSLSAELEGSLLRIDGASRLNIGAEYNTTSLLTEAERGVIQSAPAAPGAPDAAPFRSLIADTQSAQADASWSTGLGEMGAGGQLTVNGQVTREHRRTLSGLDPVLANDPRTRLTRTAGYSLGTALNKPLGGWRLALTADANRTISDTRIDAAVGTPPVAGFDAANSKTYAIDTLATLTGQPLALPGGEVNLTVKGGYNLNGIDSRDTRSGGQAVSLDRRRANGGVNLAIPIASAREGFLAPLGELNLDLGGGIETLSDFGTLTDWSAGFNWGPSESLSLQASYREREVAPSLGNLGNPAITDFNVPVFDFTRGQTVLATITSGGNPALLAETQRDVKLSANYDFDLFDRASFRIEYFRNRSDDVTAGFPLLTPAIEAAYPGRVARAADGTLLSIDRRPVTFAEQNSQRIRYGFNLFGRVGKAQEREGASEGGRRSFGGGAAGGASPRPAEVQTREGGGVDSGRFAELRARFCATPAGETPDLSALPERMLERLKGEDGQIDPAKVTAMRERFCSVDGAQRGPARLDPERFAALRKLLCDDPAAPIDVASLPEEVQARLKGPDGQLDPERLAQFRSRICAMPAPEAGQRSEGGERRGADAGRRGGGGGGRGGGMPFGPGRGGDGQGRWNLSLYHTVELQNEVLIAPGGPFLDLLGGDALGEGGVSRHKLQLEGGVFHKGIGVRLSGNYQGGSTVRGSGLPGSSDLRFGDLATFDLRLFVNLEQQKWLTGDSPGFWKGTRFSLRADNLLDAQQRVTDDTRTVPLRYQPALIDPVGRYIEIEFRKMF